MQWEGFLVDTMGGVPQNAHEESLVNTNLLMVMILAVKVMFSQKSNQN
jgi:hypothetical protein